MWCGENWGVERDRVAVERKNSNVMASVSVSVASARDAGGWDASLPRWGDWDLWKRVLAAGGRAGAIGDPTVLHFRATDRVQPWSDRVRQNTAWSERLDDAAELAGIRRALGALRDDRDTRILGLLADCERELAWIRATRWWRLRVWLARMRSRATRAER